MHMNIRILLMTVLLAGWLPSGARAAEARFTLSLPIRCELGRTCWIPNYVDLKPGKGVLDYTCGTATYDAAPTGQHKGTDFAIRDLAAMRRGIPVLAADSGLVIARRDGMKDINIKDVKDGSVRHKECGNAVRIQHDTGLITQYCHMRRGSVRVKAGDRVERGQTLGLVGLSGKTAFPHLHFQVMKNKRIIDPFVGLSRQKACGVGEYPLWTKKALTKLPYQPTAIYNAGFTDRKPKPKSISKGLYAATVFSPTAPSMVLWGEFFRVKRDDRIVMTILNPQGEKVHETHRRIQKDQAYYMAYSGFRRRPATWGQGVYRGKIVLIRENKPLVISRQIEVR